MRLKSESESERGRERKKKKKERKRSNFLSKCKVKVVQQQRRRRWANSVPARANEGAFAVVSMKRDVMFRNPSCSATQPHGQTRWHIDFFFWSSSENESMSFGLTVLVLWTVSGFHLLQAAYFFFASCSALCKQSVVWKRPRNVLQLSRVKVERRRAIARLLFSSLRVLLYDHPSNYELIQRVPEEDFFKVSCHRCDCMSRNDHFAA